VDELRFKTLLEAYGADVERWPAAERDAGRRQLTAVGESERDLVSDSAALDALLRAPQPVQPSAALVGRIMQAAQDRPRPGGLFAPGAIALAGFSARAQLAAACLMLVSLGVVGGWIASHDVLGSVAADALLTASYGEVSDDWFSVEGL
jgi:hypothetical protein